MRQSLPGLNQMWSTLPRRCFVYVAIFVAIIVFLRPVATTRDPFKGMQPDVRRFVEDVQSRKRLYAWTWNKDQIVFRLVGCENITDSAFVSMIDEVQQQLVFVQNGTKLALGLNIADSKITDNGLQEIGRLSSITSLSLPNGITDAGVKDLEQLPQLEHLDISNTQITDNGFATFTRPERIKSLNLSRSITDDGLAYLTRFSGLERLSVIGVSNNGLAHLKGLASLREISVASTQVTDEGIMQLSGLSELHVLGLTSSGVTETGAKQLKISIPNLTIYLQGGPGPAKTL